MAISSIKRREFLKIAAVSVAMGKSGKNALSILSNQLERNGLFPVAGELVATRAFDWIASNRLYFNPFYWGVLPEEWCQTALAELSLLCYHLRGREQFRDDSHVEKCLDTIEQVYRKPLFHEYIFRGDRLSFGGHLGVWITLGHRNIETVISRESLQQIIDVGNVLSVERLPFRLLELRYFLDLGGFRHNMPSEADIFSRTFLDQDFDLASIMDSDIYSITHTIFYLTDFGGRVSPLLSGEREESLLELLEFLLGMVIHARNWDLVAELILSYRCIRSHDSTLVKLGWKALQLNQGQDGSIRDLTLSKKGLKRFKDKASRKKYEFRRRYHATLTTVMAGFLGKKRSHAG